MNHYISQHCRRHGEWRMDLDNPRDCPLCDEARTRFADWTWHFDDEHPGGGDYIPISVALDMSAKLNDVCTVLGNSRWSWQIATCNVMAHQITQLQQDGRRFWEIAVTRGKLLERALPMLSGAGSGTLASEILEALK